MQVQPLALESYRSCFEIAVLGSVDAMWVCLRQRLWTSQRSMAYLRLLVQVANRAICCRSLCAARVWTSGLTQRCRMVTQTRLASPSASILLGQARFVVRRA